MTAGLGWAIGEMEEENHLPDLLATLFSFMRLHVVLTAFKNKFCIRDSVLDVKTVCF